MGSPAMDASKNMSKVPGNAPGKKTLEQHLPIQTSGLDNLSSTGGLKKTIGVDKESNIVNDVTSAMSVGADGQVDKKNWWSGEGFSTDSILAQASAEDPTAIGAGTLLGGKLGGGIGGVLGATLRSVGASMTGGDPTWMTESSLYKDRTPTVDNSGIDELTKESVIAPEDTNNYMDDMSANDYKAQNNQEYQKSFQQNFKQARDAKAKTFKWIAEDGIEREYNTQLSNETAEEWDNFIQNTTADNTASKMLVEDDALQISYETDVTYAHSNIDDQIASSIAETNSTNAFDFSIPSIDSPSSSYMEFNPDGVDGGDAVGYDDYVNMSPEEKQAYIDASTDSSHESIMQSFYDNHPRFDAYR